jgi:hypothetical protein
MELGLLARAAADLMTYLREQHLPACLIGGMVVSRWGEPRATQDVDATVAAEFGNEPAVLKILLQRYPSRVPDPSAFAARARIALLVLPGQINGDVSLAALPFEREAIERASDWQLAEDVILPTCSAEDLVVYKLVAGRPGDIQDVIGIVRRQAGRLDVERIRRWGREFAELKEDPDLLRPFEDALRRADRQRPI